MLSRSCTQREFCPEAGKMQTIKNELNEWVHLEGTASVGPTHSNFVFHHWCLKRFKAVVSAALWDFQPKGLRLAVIWLPPLPYQAATIEGREGKTRKTEWKNKASFKYRKSRQLSRIWEFRGARSAPAHSGKFCSVAGRSSLPLRLWSLVNARAPRCPPYYSFIP